ncbi:MAG: hypothetical protein IJY47_06230 [Clostridia bacterium]|nr:hypothetical protein [Clostridia bacterium]
MFGRIVKAVFFLIIFSVIFFLIWRVFSSTKPPESVAGLEINDDLYAAYLEEGEDLRLWRQSQNTLTRGEDNAGYFGASDCVFIPGANQVQLLVRYNNSTIRALAEDYQLASVPSREEELYDITLVLATDLTPDVTEDNAGNDPASVRFIRLHPVSSTSDTKNMYNYRRLVFDLDEGGVSLEDLTESGLLLAVYADFYYNQDIRYDENAYGTLCLYDYLSETLVEKPESEDRRALKNYKKEN